MCRACALSWWYTGPSSVSPHSRRPLLLRLRRPRRLTAPRPTSPPRPSTPVPKGTEARVGEEKGTTAARGRNKSGGDAGEEQVRRQRDGRRRRRERTKGYAGEAKLILGFLFCLALAREITLLPFHLQSTRGATSGTKLVSHSTNLCRPLDLPESNVQDSVPQGTVGP